MEFDMIVKQTLVDMYLLQDNNGRTIFDKLIFKNKYDKTIIYDKDIAALLSKAGSDLKAIHLPTILSLLKSPNVLKTLMINVRKKLNEVSE